MKKLILAVMLFSSVLGFSQGERKFKKSDLTVEQKVELQAKKMKLDLDLTDAQLLEVKKLLTEQVKKRETIKSALKEKKEKGEKPTSEEIFAMQNNKLDDQIAMKAEMKSILRPDQYLKWEQMVSERRDKIKEKREKRKEVKPNREEISPNKE